MDVPFHSTVSNPLSSRSQPSITTTRLKMWNSPCRSATPSTSWRCMRVSAMASCWAGPRKSSWELLINKALSVKAQVSLSSRYSYKNLRSTLGYTAPCRRYFQHNLLWECGYAQVPESRLLSLDTRGLSCRTGRHTQDIRLVVAGRKHCHLGEDLFLLSAQRYQVGGE